MNESKLNGAINVAFGQVAQLFMSQPVRGTQMYMPVGDMEKITQDLIREVRRLEVENEKNELIIADNQLKTKTKAWKEFYGKKMFDIETRKQSLEIYSHFEDKTDEELEREKDGAVMLDLAQPHLKESTTDTLSTRQVMYKLDHHDSPQKERQKDNRRNA